jgi:hypothetical protein
MEKLPIQSKEKPKEKFPNIDPEIAKHLEKIDFEKLRDVYLQKISDLGLNPEEFRDKFVSNDENFKDIGFVRGLIVSGGAYEKSRESKEGVIRFDRKFFDNFKNSFWMSLSENKEQDMNDKVQLVLMHEEAHALSFFNESESGSGHKTSVTVQGGYSEQTIKTKFYVIPSLDRKHTFFNEAVTDVIAKEMFKEYTQREPSDLVGSPRRLKNVVFENIIEKICIECGIEKDILLNVIMRGYFGGPEDLSGEKMGRLFGSIFPKDFEQRLRKMSSVTSGDAQFIEESLEQSVWTDKDRERIRRWVMHVYRQMPISKKKQEKE